MVFSSGVVRGDELNANGFSLLGEVVQYSQAVVLLELIRPPVDVFLAVSEHGVEQSRQLVGNLGRCAIFLSGLSNSSSVCWPSLRIRFMAFAVNAHKRWFVLNMTEGMRSTAVYDFSVREGNAQMPSLEYR